MFGFTASPPLIILGSWYGGVDAIFNFLVLLDTCWASPSLIHYFLPLCRHLIGFFLFLSLTIYTAKMVPNVVDLPRLQNFPDVLRKADFQKLHAELITCLPSLPHMPDLQRLREELKNSLHSMDLLPSLSNWHIMELLSNCLPESLSHSNNSDTCVLVFYFLFTVVFSGLLTL